MSVMNLWSWMLWKLRGSHVAQTVGNQAFTFEVDQEDLDDMIVIDQRKNEEAIPFDTVLADIEAGRLVDMDHAMTAPYDPSYWTEDYQI